MGQRLVLCLAMLAFAAPAAAEDWRPVPGEASAYFDNDFLRVDQATGLVVMRYAIGKAEGAGYKAWPKGKSPIMLYALDCEANAFKDLGLDFEGDKGVPKGWRDIPTDEDMDLVVGAAGTAACERRETLPRAALP